nr:MAG TPA: Somatostatin/Cortistatin family [Caudoviricetes sp.]
MSVIYFLIVTQVKMGCKYFFNKFLGSTKQ